jgi:putative phosphoribosyl transferase
MNDALPGNDPALLRFKNRADAAFRLARALASYRDPRTLVLGIPRGGVILGQMIAQRLGGELDIFLLQEISVSGQPELVIGAVTEFAPVIGIGGWKRMPSESSLQAKVEEARSHLRKQRLTYTPHRSAISPAGRWCILVTDGLATDTVMTYALRSLRQCGAERVVVAAPVITSRTFEALRGEAHEVICLRAPEPFRAVSDFFDDFPEVTEEEVFNLLRRASEGSEGQPWRPDQIHHGNCGFHPTRPSR